MTSINSKPEADTYLDGDFSKWLDTLLLKAHQPGLSIAVIKDGRIESAGFGLAQLPDIAATSETLWPMASTTKAFTTALVGMLLEDRALSAANDMASKTNLEGVSWKTPVSHILPEDFVTTDDYVTNHATIEDIASHRSGVAGHDLVWGPVMGNSLSTAARYLRHFEAVEDKFRSAWQYNNLMYGVLGSIVERLSGQSFVDALRDRILTPLDMQQTWLGMQEIAEHIRNGSIQKSQVARGYFWCSEDDAVDGSDDANGFYTPDHHVTIDGIEPAGGLVSSVDDFAKWVLALLQSAHSKESDAGQGSPLISHDLWKELTTPRIQIIPTAFDSKITPVRPYDYASPTSYCLGWTVDTQTYPGETIIFHGGGLQGFSTRVTLLPERDIGIVIAGNGGMLTSTCEAVTKELFGRRLGIPKEERRSTIAEVEKPVEAIASEVTLQDATSATERSRQILPDVNSDESEELNTAHLEGLYVHPAYGTLQITATDSSAALTKRKPSVNGARVVRQKDLEGQDAFSKALNSLPEAVGTRRVLLVKPLGVRGLATNYLLHPASTQPDQAREIYNLETMWPHGDLTDDVLEGLESEIKDTSEGGYPLKLTVLWQSIGVKEAAAVFEYVDSDKGRGKEVTKVGLRLMRVDGSMDRKKKAASGDVPKLPLEEGWENRMIWLTRVYD